jgi:hypothetical protein
VGFIRWILNAYKFFFQHGDGLQRVEMSELLNVINGFGGVVFCLIQVAGDFVCNAKGRLRGKDLFELGRGSTAENRAKHKKEHRCENYQLG